MRKKTVINITATLAAVEYPTADFNTPFVRGRECVLCVAKSADYDAGALLIETDNASDGSYSDVRATGVGDAGTAGYPDLETYNITLGDNIRVTSGTFVAGSCEIFLLGDS